MDKIIEKEVSHFLQEQGFVIVTSWDKDGFPHNSCKGIVEISEDGKIYLLDLYQGQTFRNIKHNHRISITAVDEHKFLGYSIKGFAYILEDDSLKGRLAKDWEEKIVKRVSQRILRNLSGQKGHPRHPEMLLPFPKHLIAFTPKKIVNLTPRNLKEEA